jgi:urate oxidase
VAVVLGANRYGKAEIRLVHVARDNPTHVVTDLNVSVALAGDLAAAHVAGDNRGVLPTDTQKNTVYAFAAEYGVGRIEEFGLRLARHFVHTQPSIDRARVAIRAYPWRRLGPHSFERAGDEVRTARVTVHGDEAWVVAGVADLVLMNTTDSEFAGFVRDRYTTLPEAADRILATAVTAEWRHASAADTDWAASWTAARAALVGAFTGTYSRALQQTLYTMGERVLAERAELAEVRLSLPNRHHFLVDLAPFAIHNDGVVFHADDRPYGLIEGVVRRDDAPDAPAAWDSSVWTS